MRRNQYSLAFLSHENDGLGRYSAKLCCWEMPTQPCRLKEVERRFIERESEPVTVVFLQKLFTNANVFKSRHCAMNYVTFTRKIF